MINYKLRQEKRGAYLLDCRRGTALHLPQPAFDLLMDLYTAGSLPPGWSQAGQRRRFAEADEGWHWWQTFQEMGLTTEKGLQSLEVIPLVEDPATVPDDCLVAPARVYFELTRRCNLSCLTCFNESHYPLAHELTTPEIFDVLKQLDQLHSL